MLVIHTNKSGEITESDTKKYKDELEKLRRAANQIDDWNSPYKAIVSVLMLREGWDVRNVTTIVGLRAYAAKSNILPEQTLGRGLRRMYPNKHDTEYVSVIGTAAFMEFIESIRIEGVELEHRPMSADMPAGAPLVIEVDWENSNKNIAQLDLRIPVLTPRLYRDYHQLQELAVAQFTHRPLPYQHYSTAALRKIVFRDIATNKITHTTQLDNAVNDYRHVIGYFAQTLMRELHLVGCYDLLYDKIKTFISQHLFTTPVNVDDPNTIRNLAATKTLIETFKTHITALTTQDKGTATIRDHIVLSHTRPFVVNEQNYLVAKKSVFNKIVGDSQFELDFAAFLERCNDIVAYAKNYRAVNMRVEYVNATGEIAHYYPDFFVQVNPHTIYIVETKGLTTLDVPHKIERLRTWCADVNAAQSDIQFAYLVVTETEFTQYPPRSLSELKENFMAYQSSPAQ